MSKSKQQLKAELDAAQEAYDRHKCRIDHFIVGHIDDDTTATRVIQVFRDNDIPMMNEFNNGPVFIKDAQWFGDLLRGGYWSGASYAGLFHASLNNVPTYSSTNLGFRCVARPASMTTCISAEEFLRRFEDEDS